MVRKLSAKAKQHIPEKEISAINDLDSDQLWLLSKAHMFQSDTDFEEDAIRARLGVSEKQCKAVNHVIEHYAAGMSIGAITPASVVGQLIEQKMKPKYAVNLANSAHSAYRYMRNIAESNSFFIAGDIRDILDRLTALESIINSENTNLVETE